MPQITKWGGWASASTLSHLSSPDSHLTLSALPCHPQITKSGALDIKILPRTANLEGPSGPQGPPPEQDIPLQVRVCLLIG